MLHACMHDSKNIVYMDFYLSLLVPHMSFYHVPQSVLAAKCGTKVWHRSLMMCTCACVHVAYTCVCVNVLAAHGRMYMRMRMCTYGNMTNAHQGLVPGVPKVCC